MLILRGNNSGPGVFPDEQGNLIDWPIGALHVQAATIYAQKRGYEAVVLDKPGQARPQGKDSPQSQAALKAFLDPNDQTVAAFYGFSGGGLSGKGWLTRKLLIAFDRRSQDDLDSAAPHHCASVLSRPRKEFLWSRRLQPEMRGPSASGSPLRRSCSGELSTGAADADDGDGCY
jgi:hypothetical protein